MSSKKCAHPLCHCLVDDKQKYCSNTCEDSKDLTTLACECGHPACASDKL